MTDSAITIDAYLAERRQLVDDTLERHLRAASTRPTVIHEAVRYSVMAGGKRLRPILAIAAAEACGASVEPLIRHFCALELIHTYSLVHDDLPALDNDDLRRGRKTAHVVFGEAIAILAGDALLTEAFLWLSQPIASVQSVRQMEAIRTVAAAIDSEGMIGGQVADLAAERIHEAGHEPDQLRDELAFIHRNKTGRLLTASVELGGILGGGTGDQVDLLREYGRTVGLAFQIVDDLLDQEGTDASLGKTAGKDLEQGKLTWPALYGAETARREAATLIDAAIQKAAMIGGSMNYLGEIARYISARKS